MNILDQAASSIGNDIFGYGTNPYCGSWYDNAQNIAAMQAQANYANKANAMQDINACYETVYPVKNNNSMNKKLEAAKKYLESRK